MLEKDLKLIRQLNDSWLYRKDVTTKIRRRTGADRLGGRRKTEVLGSKDRRRDLNLLLRVLVNLSTYRYPAIRSSIRARNFQVVYTIQLILILKLYFLLFFVFETLIDILIVWICSTSEHVRWVKQFKLIFNWWRNIRAIQTTNANRVKFD